MKAKYILSAILMFFGTMLFADNIEKNITETANSENGTDVAVVTENNTTLAPVQKMGWDDWDDEDEFQYSRKLRRFHRNGSTNRGNSSWGYYDPYFTSNVYYTIGTPMWNSYFYYQPAMPVVQVSMPWWWAFTASAFYTPTYFNYGYYNPYGGGFYGGGMGYYGYGYCGGWHPHGGGYWNGYNNGYWNGYNNGFNQGYWAGYNQGFGNGGGFGNGYGNGYGGGYGDDWWYWRKENQTNTPKGSNIGVQSVSNPGNSIPRNNQNSNIGLNPNSGFNSQNASPVVANPRNNAEPVSTPASPRPKWDSQSQYQGGAVKGNASEPGRNDVEPRPRNQSWNTEPKSQQVTPSTTIPKGNVNGNNGFDNSPRNNNQGNFNTEPVRPRQENFEVPRNNSIQNQPRPTQNETWNAPAPRSNAYQTEPVKPKTMDSQPKTNYENPGFNNNANQSYGRPSNQPGFEQNRPRNNQSGTGAAQNGQFYPSNSGQQPVVRPRTEQAPANYSPRPQSEGPGRNQPAPKASQPTPRSSTPAPSSGRPSGNTPGRKSGMSNNETTNAAWMVVP